MAAPMKTISKRKDFQVECQRSFLVKILDRSALEKNSSVGGG